MAQKQDGKIVLYWLDQSRSQRVLWLMEELNLQYELKTYKRRTDQTAPPELKEIHPLGKAPILTIQSETGSKPIVLAESGTIIEYLTDHYGARLVPTRYTDGKEGQAGGETEEWLRYRYYMHFAEGSMMPYLVFGIVLKIVNKSAPFLIKPVARLLTGAIESNFLAPNMKTTLDFLESQIASSPNHGEYLCGPKLTGADIMMSFPLQAAKSRAGFKQEVYPKLWAYVDRLAAHEGYKKAADKIIELEGAYTPNL